MNYKENPTHVMTFIMLLGEMLMVKMGVSDHQQAPPHQTFAHLE